MHFLQKPKWFFANTLRFLFAFVDPTVSSLQCKLIAINAENSKF